MNIGFTTFCTENYKEIMDCLVESILEFSKYGITIFSINFDYVHNNDRVIVKRIDLPNLDYYTICKVKIIASLESGYDIGLILDSDMIATNKIDEIFDENYDKIINSEYPLFAKHPHNPFTNPNHHAINTIKHFTDKTPKMKYVYASFLFSNKNKWFLEEVLNTMNQTFVIGEDEIIINALLAKYEVDYDIGYNYLPNGYDAYVNDYLTNTTSSLLFNEYLQYDCPVKYYLFHGHNCKDPVKMKEYINLMKQNII